MVTPTSQEGGGEAAQDGAEGGLSWTSPTYTTTHHSPGQAETQVITPAAHILEKLPFSPLPGARGLTLKLGPSPEDCNREQSCWPLLPTWPQQTSVPEASGSYNL